MLAFYADLNLFELEGSSNNTSISTLYNMGFSFYQKGLDANLSNAMFDPLMWKKASMIADRCKLEVIDL